MTQPSDPVESFADLAGSRDQPSVGYCTDCGTDYSARQTYCGHCGRRLSLDRPRQEPSGVLPAAGPAPSPGGASGSYLSTPAFGPVDDLPYGPGATVGAVLLALFVPFISLIVALVMRAQEPRSRRRQFLKNWAIGSGAWLCTGFLIPLIALSAGGSAASGCQGGIDQTVPPSFQSNDGVHWTATYTCMNGGTETKAVPSSQVPGGGG
jgi:hypothetical protein